MTQSAPFEQDNRPDGAESPRETPRNTAEAERDWFSHAAERWSLVLVGVVFFSPIVLWPISALLNFLAEHFGYMEQLQRAEHALWVTIGAAVVSFWLWAIGKRVLKTTPPEKAWTAQLVEYFDKNSVYTETVDWFLFVTAMLFPPMIAVNGFMLWAFNVSSWKSDILEWSSTQIVGIIVFFLVDVGFLIIAGTASEKASAAIWNGLKALGRAAPEKISEARGAVSSVELPSGLGEFATRMMAALIKIALEAGVWGVIGALAWRATKNHDAGEFMTATITLAVVLLIYDFVIRNTSRQGLFMDVGTAAYLAHIALDRGEFSIERNQPDDVAQVLMFGCLLAALCWGVAKAFEMGRGSKILAMFIKWPAAIGFYGVVNWAAFYILGIASYTLASAVTGDAKTEVSSGLTFLIVLTAFALLIWVNRKLRGGLIRWAFGKDVADRGGGGGAGRRTTGKFTGMDLK